MNPQQPGRPMQYLLLIHRDTQSAPTAQEWTAFFSRAEATGLFRGGSELGARELVGEGSMALSTAHVAGYMRFDAEDKVALLDLLKTHPVVLHGGSVELCEMPETAAS